MRGKKKSSSRTLGHNMVPMPASKLAYSLQGLEEVSLSTAPQRWSQERCRNCLAKVMSCLKVCQCSAISATIISQRMPADLLSLVEMLVLLQSCAVCCPYALSLVHPDFLEAGKQPTCRSPGFIRGGVLCVPCSSCHPLHIPEAGVASLHRWTALQTCTDLKEV